uniref:DNA/RNA nuclease SfsA n=1 Tax=Ningiella ruwaisensis TaxID=2364274 RepID=UPI0010A06FCE|nr:DNA/RNA nuclease SfsA [Ningiella ruwaisensis]
MYKFTSALIQGKLVKRYKRFLADVELSSGNIITAHCPNTGAMTGCDAPGADVWLSKSTNTKRKYAYTWEYSSDGSGNKIGVNTANANRVVRDALLNRRIPELAHYSRLQAEVKRGASRIDFKLTEDGAIDAFCEVKSVTLRKSDNAYFPDAVSTRGQKHCRELAEIAKNGELAYLLFCIQLENIRSFGIAHFIDPKYQEAFEYAKENGVEMLAYGCQMTERGIELSHKVEIS